MDEGMGCIYLVTNTVNGRRYVGQTRHPTPANRFRAHKYNSKKFKLPLYNEIREFGKDAFKVETLCVVPHESLNNMEAYWAEQLQTYVWDPPMFWPRGYNVRECGTDPDTYIKPKDMSSWWIGRKHKPESLIKMGNIHRGKVTPPEVRQKQSQSHMGMQPTETAKEAARVNRIESVINNGAKGVKLKKEDILEIVKQHTDGMSQTELAAKYNVQVSVISRIMSGDRWGYITGITRAREIRKRGPPLGLEVANKIRDKYQAGGESYNSLAAAYNVTYSTIHNIVKGKLYPVA